MKSVSNASRSISMSASETAQAYTKIRLRKKTNLILSMSGYIVYAIPDKWKTVHFNKNKKNLIRENLKYEHNQIGIKKNECNLTLHI